MIGMPVELREKIVDFALFGKNAPELKAVKDEDESENHELCSGATMTDLAG